MAAASKTSDGLLLSGRAILRLVVGVAAIAVVWQASVLLFGIRPYYLPRLSVVLEALAATPDAYIASLLRTASETLLGYAAGALFGIALGSMFFHRKVLKDTLFPMFVVSQTIPVIAFGAVIVLWFGNTLFAKAVMAFYLTFFPVTVNTLLGLQSVDPAQVSLMKSFGAPRRQVFWKLQFPNALPQIFVALRLATSLSLVGAMVGEWFGDTVGLGVLLLQATYNENVVGIWAALLVAAALGTLFYAAVAGLERKLVFWRVER
ncbi:NitT/TauT family transport system permease protein [Enhydrobacter aerosaccus]|uniref:NitT/TauT family transport system permease protein n=1 Tax=Enhydrobacter aerosaccus TaxID=225324 RepID=A0A1T4JQJ3_9HYPH|nr:ABC transporter permease [Enhydrobacter aerosaccus]SJZ32448.1 NitT/TauT family transport system permease protein [Enhydrobacter aerosaccus]